MHEGLSLRSGARRFANFIAADVFLRANDYLFTGDPIELGRQLEAVATRADSAEEATDRFAKWLRANVKLRG